MRPAPGSIGLDHATHEVIELGMVAFTYETGIQDVVRVFSALREPSYPITPEITRLAVRSEQQ